MKKKLVLGQSLLLLVLLVSCNPFSMNIFSGIDNMEMPDLTSTSDLLSVADEPQFYENLSNDPDAKAQVISTLEDAMYNSTDTTTQQEAALMLADVHLKTSGSDETLSNLNSVIGDALDGEEVFDPDNPETLLDAIFDDSLSQAEIAEQLQAFYDAATALETYGNTLEDNDPPNDTNSGDAATKALISGAAKFIIDSGNTVDDVAAYVATGSPALTVGAVTDPSEIFDATPGLLNVVDEGLGVGAIDDLLGSS